MGSIGCCPTTKARKLSTSFLSSSLPRQSISPLSSSVQFIATLPPQGSSSPPEASTSIPVLSPCTYMTISLKNKKIKPRIDSFSLEQALYFEPYQESEIRIDLLKALRGSNIEKLRSFQEENSNAKRGVDNDDNDSNNYSDDKPRASRVNDEDRLLQLQARNQFGENLVHIACRMGLSWDVLKFLVKDAKVPLNVRDRFGRTPLHNACMSSLPNFDNIDYVIKYAPRLVLFEDDDGKIPFELIPSRCFERWTRFLSEKSVFKSLCKDLSMHEGLTQKG